MKINKAELKKFIFATLGIAFLALSINILSWQYTLISGGMPGYALALNYVFNINIGLFLLILNTVILGVNLLVLGRGDGIKAIYGYVLFSILIEITREFMGLKQIEISSQYMQLGLIVLQGIIAPVGISMTLLNGYSFGSWSTIYPMISRYFKRLTAPQFFFIMDILLSILIGITLGWYKGILVAVNSIVFYFAFRYCMTVFKRYFN